MDSVIVLLICLAGTYIFSGVFKHIGLPKVLGPLSVGLIIGSSYLKAYFFNQNAMELITLLKDLALILMLFFVGLKIEFKQFIKSSKLSLSVGFSSSLFSLLLGYLVTIGLYYFGIIKPLIPEGVSIHLVGFVVGLCLSETAEAVAVDILEEVNLLTTKIGETIIESGVVDDIVSLVGISVLVTLMEPNTNSGIQVILVLFEILAFVIVTYLLSVYVIPRVMKFVESEHSRIDFFVIALVIALFLSVISLELGLSAVLGALVAGIIVRHVLLAGDRIERREERDITSIIEITTFGMLTPFFFIWIGTQTDLGVIYQYPIVFLLIALAAFAGKIFGSMGSAKAVGETTKEGFIIGWGMNVRGSVDFIIAAIALQNHIMTQSLFSLIVAVAFFATFISPIVFKLLVKKHHGVD